MATHVIYNEVEIHNCITRQWDQRVVYDPSDADVERHEYMLSFEGTLSASSLRNSDRTWIDQQGATTPGSNSTATLYDVLKRRLSSPRGHLRVVLVSCPEAGTFAAGGTVTSPMLEVRPPAPSAFGRTKEIHDIDQGPKPQEVSLLQIVSDKLFRVKFTIKCSVLHCPGAVGNSVPYVISNRWSTSESMDDNFYVTKTIRGRMKVSEPFNSPHGVKALIIPRLEAGFRRVSILMATSANGLEADYEITDRQTHTSAPYPATKISGTYTESTSDGVLWFGQVNVKLEGSPEASKVDMHSLLIRIVDAKLNIKTMGAENFNTRYQIVNFTLSESIGSENTVNADVRIRHIAGPDEQQALGSMLALLKDNLGQPLDIEQFGDDPYDPTVSRFPAVYGYNPQGDVRSAAGALTLFCALHDPCSADKFYRPGQETQPEGDADKETKVISKQYPGKLEPADYEDPYDDTHKEAIYQHYETETTYRTNQCRVQLPVANAGLANTKPTSVVANLCRPQTTRVLVVTASRIGKMPEIPEPVESYTDGAITGKLLRHWVKPVPRKATVEGAQKVYELEAYYEYALDRPPLKTEQINVGITAYLKDTREDNAFAQSEIYNSRLNV